MRALRAGRRGRAVELNAEYFRDGVRYLRSEEQRVNAPTLFDLEQVLAEPVAEPEVAS